jgi:structure-specific recognition protein 1
MDDWAKVCSAFNLNLTDVMSVLGSKAPVRREVRRAAPVRSSSTSVSDSESEASAPASIAKDNFANSKARAFAAENGLSAEDVTGTGKNGKVKLGDLKKLLPPKKRGRKPKAAAPITLDMVDSLAQQESPKAKKAPEAPKGKRVKDPNHPKHPSTAWIFFLNANRNRLRKEHPDAKMTDITKLASAAWKAIAPADRGPWDAKAATDKERYATEMSTYVAPEPVFVLAKKKKVKSAVKKATNPWMAYLNGNRNKLRAEHPEVKMTDITKMASVAYKALSDADRVEWVAIAEADKLRYAKELAEHLAKQSPTASPEAPKAKKAPEADKALAKVEEKVAKVQTKVDGIVKEILSYVALNKLNAADEKALRARVKDVDEHCSNSLIDGVTMKEMKSLLKEQKALQRQLVKQAKKAPKAKKAAEPVVLDDAEEVEFDLGDSDDDELDEEPDAPTEFEWQGTTYWLTWHGHVMDEEDGAIVGRWDEESESVVFDQ